MSFPTILESIEDLNRTQIEKLLISCQKIIQDTDHGKNWHNYQSKFKDCPIISTFFFEPSTRTKNSFIIAATRAGCQNLDFKADESSLKKGEQLDETFKTLKAQGVELIVIRSNQAHILDQFKKSPILPIINGGDGSNQHPTQALTDLLTALSLGHIKEGQNLLIIGDAKYSRVVHSLIPIFMMWNINIIISTLPYFLPDDQTNFTYIKDLDLALKEANMVYLLRPQSERHLSSDINYKETLKQLIANYQITLLKMKHLKRFVPIYHPGPANIGVEITQDIISSKYYQAYQQVNYSIYMRMTLIEEMIINLRNRNVKH